MRFSELKQKEVINICDGQRLGNVCDIEFDLSCTKITHIIVPGPCKIWGILGRDEEYVIDVACIRRIGEDVVLVEVCLEKVRRKCDL